MISSRLENHCARRPFGKRKQVRDSRTGNRLNPGCKISGDDDASARSPALQNRRPDTSTLRRERALSREDAAKSPARLDDLRYEGCPQPENCLRARKAQPAELDLSALGFSALSSAPAARRRRRRSPTRCDPAKRASILGTLSNDSRSPLSRGNHPIKSEIAGPQLVERQRFLRTSGR